MALEKEMETYEARRGDLLSHAGEYVLISGDDVIGFFRDYVDALSAGYEKCGVSRTFLVKKVEQLEEALFFTRDIPQCRT